MKFTKFKLASVALMVSTASVSLIVGSAQPANAVYSCSAGYSSVGAYAKCGLPTNRWYHANVVCRNWATGSSYVKGGNWVNTSSSTPSTIQSCNSPAWESFYGTPWASE